MDEHELRLEEFKILVNIGRDYFGFYLRAVVLYLAVLGIVFKLFLDSETADERLTLFFVGVGVNVYAALGTLAAIPKYKAIAKRCDTLAQKLGMPNVYFPATIMTAWAFLAGIAIIGCGWLLLLKLL